MSFHAKDFAGSHCGCRYQQDYRPTLGRDGKKESGTLEVIKFYYDGAIRFEQHCYGHGRRPNINPVRRPPRAPAPYHSPASPAGRNNRRPYGER